MKRHVVVEFTDYRDIIRQMEREMLQLSDDVFRGFFDSTLASGRFWHPSVDVYENDTHLIVKAELAGVRSEDLQVSLSPDDRVLTISGTRHEGSDGRSSRLRAHQLEVYFGPFQRSITLPQGVSIDRDEIGANYKEGMLLISIPKVPRARQQGTRVIPITNGHSGPNGGAVDVSNETAAELPNQDSLSERSVPQDETDTAERRVS